MIDKMITDLDIEAFIDKELSEEEEQRVLTYLEQDAHKRGQYKNIFRQKLLLKEWWAKKPLK